MGKNDLCRVRLRRINVAVRFTCARKGIAQKGGLYGLIE